MASVAGQQDSIIVEKGISYALTDTTCQTKLATILGIKKAKKTYLYKVHHSTDSNSSVKGFIDSTASYLACSSVSWPPYLASISSVMANPIRFTPWSSWTQRTFPWLWDSIDAKPRSAAGMFVLKWPSIRTHLKPVRSPSKGMLAVFRTREWPPSAPTMYLLPELASAQ